MIIMELLDAHCHLMGKKIFSQLLALRVKWKKNHIKRIINVCSTLQESETALQVFKDYPEVINGIGKHPWKVKRSDLDEMNKFETLIASSKCKVIGEVGLDYYAIKEVEKYELQREWFSFFIDMSNKYKKPLNIHVTGAEQDILKLLTEKWNKAGSVNIHWYSGSLDTLEGLIELGCYFSINPAIYYSQGHQNALQKMPIERLLTESDGDVFYKQLNLLGEPSVIPQVLDKICKIKKYEKEELANLIVSNFDMYLH